MQIIIITHYPLCINQTQTSSVLTSFMCGETNYLSLVNWKFCIAFGLGTVIVKMLFYVSVVFPIDEVPVNLSPKNLSPKYNYIN